MKRICYFDNIKGLLILCVILTHTLRTCSLHYGYSYSFYKLITFFIIPLFIFVTGKFAKKDRKTPLNRSLRMLKIFIIAQILVTLYYGYVLQTIDPSKNLLTPRFTLWYLLTCSFLYLSEYILRKVKFKNIFIISIIVALGIGFIPIITDFLSLSRTIAVFPFFILGYYSEEINFMNFVKKTKKIIIPLVIIISIWFLFNQGFFLYKDTYLKYSYFVYRTPIECFLKRCLLYLFAFIFSDFILIIMPNKKNIFTTLGRNTLTFYLLHGVMLKTILHYNLFIGNYIMGTIIIYIGVISVNIVVAILVNKVKKYGKFLCLDDKIKFKFIKGKTKFT